MKLKCPYCHLQRDPQSAKKKRHLNRSVDQENVVYNKKAQRVGWAYCDLCFEAQSEAGRHRVEASC